MDSQSHRIHPCQVQASQSPALWFFVFDDTVWLLSLRLRDSSIVDIFWAIGFVLIAWIGFTLGTDRPAQAVAGRTDDAVGTAPERLSGDAQPGQRRRPALPSDAQKTR